MDYHAHSSLFTGKLHCLLVGDIANYGQFVYITFPGTMIKHQNILATYDTPSEHQKF